MTNPYRSLNQNLIITGTKPGKESYGSDAATTAKQLTSIPAISVPIASLETRVGSSRAARGHSMPLPSSTGHPIRHSKRRPPMSQPSLNLKTEPGFQPTSCRLSPNRPKSGWAWQSRPSSSRLLTRSRSPSSDRQNQGYSVLYLEILC